MQAQSAVKGEARQKRESLSCQRTVGMFSGCRTGCDEKGSVVAAEDPAVGRLCCRHCQVSWENVI